MQHNSAQADARCGMLWNMHQQIQSTFTATNKFRAYMPNASQVVCITGSYKAGKNSLSFDTRVGWDLLKAVCRACSTALATAVASGSPSAWPSFLSSAAAFSKEVARLLTTLSRTTCMQQNPSLSFCFLCSILLSVQHSEWPLPLHEYCSKTAIDEGLAKRLTILCHAHATQRKLAVIIKSKGLHMTSLRHGANVGCTLVWQCHLGF